MVATLKHYRQRDTEMAANTENTTEKRRKAAVLDYHEQEIELGREKLLR
mgnify:FL=1